MSPAARLAILPVPPDSLAMRRSLFLVAVSFSLSACAASGAAPRGWAAAPGAQRARPAPVAARPEARRPGARRPSPRFEPGAERRPLAASGLVIPVVGVSAGDLRDSFTAPRSGGRVHNAIDIAAPRGTPIVAITDGTVTRRHWNRLGGNTLYLTSADGQTDFYYAHLDEYAAGIEAGTRVRRGEVVGTVGSTGNARGPHLHLQILDKRGDGRGTPVNPYDLLRTADLAEAY